MKKSSEEVKRRNNKPSFSLFSNYRFIYSNMWEYDKSLIFYGIAEVIFNVLMPLGAVIVPSIVVGLLSNKAGMTDFIRTMAVLFLVYSIVAMVQSFLESRNGFQYVDTRCNRMASFLFSKCLHMDFQQYEEEKTREELEKAEKSIRTNIRGVEGFMHLNIKLFTNLFGMVVYSAVIGLVNPVILALLIFISIIQILVFQRAKLYEHNKKEEMAKINITQDYLQEQAFDLKAGKDIRLYQLNRLIGKVYGLANSRLKRINSKIRGIYYANDVVEIILKFLRDAVCYGYLIYLLMHGLQVSYFVLYIGIVNGIAGWVMKITENASEISRAHLMICDFREFIDKEDIFHHEGGMETGDEDMALDITFEHVSFCYSGSDEYVLEDINFKIGKGDRVALVGINGAGKTTIIKLMCGFYQPTAGRVLVNGRDLRELNIENYFKQIAVVFQDAAPLSLTIGENICGTAIENINEEELNKALVLSGLKSKIDSLEKGIHTYLNKDFDENGIQLSGGEMQKLMLAKALYKNARLLLLDEPTAALDAIAESELYEKYHRLIKGKTSVFISHRLASTRFCNNILFLEEGRIIEEGTHEMLMQQNGRYAGMFQVQSQYYKEDAKYEMQKGMA